ncbi:hypothetical protein GOB86_10055 [Acetobacter lambici]|uniref:Replication gene A protein-like domain-containing protein n=1 Tax=Acetobacter lambici TaxID=1332824 RepID=A0ABT1F114_9PROT|nr:replication endonuclease [Acetobacter lambici]MCP1242740.1 hypothetical protein [Acetobacter lambici]MCP1258887.1 hypothetical protein [Acetobacter lambici]NHO57395.1 hypothetical protein [Acetobacter lambici]
MRYEQIEIYLRNYYPNLWKNLLSLHHTYKNLISQKIAENCHSYSLDEVAEHIVEFIDSMPNDIVNGFGLMSLSYDEIREKQRITGKRLTRKSNLLRRNFRRYINVRPEDDLFQQQFDTDKQDSEKSYIIIPDSKNEDSGLSAHDIKQFNQRKKYAVNHSIAEHVDDFAINFLQYEGLFLSLTLESEFHNCSYETAKNEISKRWKKIKRILKNKDILLLGMSVLELQKDETPHYHIQLYVSSEHREYVESVILQQFPNEQDRRNEAIKDIWQAFNLISYALKDSNKSDTYINFIGLQRDIKARYNAVYHNEKYKDLSDKRISISHKLMMKKQPNGMILLLIRGFSDERLNLLSARHKDFHYLKTHIQKIQIMYLHCIHFGEFKNLIDNEFSVSMKLRTYKIINEFGDIYNYVPCWVYNNQECMLDNFYYWECEKSRGQPPPSGEGKGLIRPTQGNSIRHFSRLAQKSHIERTRCGISKKSDINLKLQNYCESENLGRPARTENLAGFISINTSRKTTIYRFSYS